MASQEETVAAVSTNLKDNIRSYVSRDTLTKALQNYLHDDSAKLDDFEVALATEEVQGFLSVMLRVKLFYQRDGKQEVKNVIVKRMPLSSVQTGMAKDANVFAKEAKTYAVIVKDMEKVNERIGLKIPLPQCYHVLIDGKNDELILEDLCESGYKLRKFKEYIDMSHFSIALKALAKFHALSVVVEKEKGKPLNQVYDCLDEGMFTSVMFGALPIFAETNKAIVEFAKLMPEYESIISDLETKCNGLFDNIGELIKPGPGLNVVLHGDAHIQNVMFRYEDERPVESVLFDLQIVRYGSPVLDLSYLLYHSSFRPFRDQHIDEILSVYHSEFTSVLDSAGVVIDNFSLEDLKKEYKKKRLYGVYFYCMAVPYLYMSDDSLPKNYEDIEEFEEKFKTSHLAKHIQMYKVNSEYREIVKPVIVEMIEELGY